MHRIEEKMSVRYTLEIVYSSYLKIMFVNYSTTQNIDVDTFQGYTLNYHIETYDIKIKEYYESMNIVSTFMLYW